jgi:hypothetical protein
LGQKTGRLVGGPTCQRAVDYTVAILWIVAWTRQSLAGDFAWWSHGNLADPFTQTETVCAFRVVAQGNGFCAPASNFSRSTCQPPANSTFLSERTSHQQPASSTLLSEQISTSHQPPANRTGLINIQENQEIA